MTIWSARCWMTTLTNLISLERQMTVMLMKIGRMGNSLVQCEPEDEEDEGDHWGTPPGTSTWPWVPLSLSPEVPFIVVILYLTLKQAVAWLLLLVNVAIIWHARDIVIININDKHLPDAVIIEMLLLMSFEYPKNKVLFFSVCYHQVPNVSQLTDLTLSKSLMRVPNVSVLTCSYLVSGTRYQNSAFLQLIFLPFLITFQKIIHFGELFFLGLKGLK